MHETLFAKMPTPILSQAGHGVHSDDGLTYTVTSGRRKWHDGEEFTADDVVFTMIIMKSHSVEKSHDYSGFTVNKTDTYTVDYVLKQPDPSFLEFHILCSSRTHLEQNRPYHGIKSLILRL